MFNERVAGNICCGSLKAWNTDRKIPSLWQKITIAGQYDKYMVNHKAMKIAACILKAGEL